MAARVSRFIDSSVDLIVAPTSLNIEEKITENLPKLSQYLEEEKASSSSFSEAWSQATDAYNSRILPELGNKDKKAINEELAKDLPDSIKETPCYVAIAAVVCTQEPPEFFAEYNKAVRTMFSGNDWDAFPFKGLFLLLSLAVKLLPCRPGRQLGKSVFRGLDTEQEFTKDQEFSLGYTASFTIRRCIALGRQPPKNDEEGEGDDEEGADDSLVPEEGVTKTILKVEMNPSLQGLGVRHLSEKGDIEREVLVLPQQKFKVTEIKNRAKKNIKVVCIAAV